MRPHAPTSAENNPVFSSIWQNRPGHILARLSLLGTIALASGCFTVNADLPGTLRGDVASTDTERVGTLSVEKNHWFYVYGLIGETPKDFFSTEIKKAVQQKGADGVANLSYQSELGCMDLVISGCTIGCVTPRSYTITGDIVRIKKSPVPGKPAKVATVDTDSDAGTSLLATDVSGAQRF